MPRRAFALACLVALAGCKPRSAPAVAPKAPVVVACGDRGCPEDGAGPPRAGGELRIHVEAEPAILCDLVEHDAWSRWIVENQIAETLFFQDPWTGAISPRLAERLPEKTNERSFVVTLRSGITWHDGKPFTVDDVLFTLDKARDPKVGADQRADLEPIERVERINERSFALHLRGPAPYLVQALSHISILPKHAYEGKDLRRAEASRAPIGTGPFKFAAWTRGEHITLVKNPSYWGEKARLDKIVFRVIRDRQVAWELYRRGELDVVWRLPTPRTFDEVRADRALAGHRVLVWTPRAYFFIVWNARKLPDPRVRRALTMLVDRDRFRQVAFNGHARPVTGPYPTGTPAYDATIAPWPFDPKAARALLDEAGVKKLKLTFLLTAGSRTVEQLATLMKEDFAKAGVTLELATVDFAVQLERLRQHAFDVSSLQWTMSLEQDNYNMFHGSQAKGGQNYGAYQSAAADALLEKIRATDDAGARHALERELHRLVHDEQPYTFLSSPEVQTVIAPRVHGLLPSTDGFTLARAWVER